MQLVTVSRVRPVLVDESPCMWQGHRSGRTAHRADRPAGRRRCGRGGRTRVGTPRDLAQPVAH